MEPDLAVVIPTYGQFDYAVEAIFSAVWNSDGDVHIILVDDGSPGWKDFCKSVLAGRLKDFQQNDMLTVHHMETNSGLTKAWNVGLQLAFKTRAAIICVANSDVLFTGGWDTPLIQALNNGLDLVGPVTNAPGTEEAQDVSRYLSHYALSDDPDVLEGQARELASKYSDVIVPGDINGFCMLARASTWRTHAYDKENVFRPRNDFNSKGQPNPTPLMTLNEYELQHRWRAAGLHIGFTPASFVFHYRAVTRGDKFKRGKWLRKKDKA